MALAWSKIRMFVPRALELLRNTSQRLPSFKKETEEEHAAKVFRYRFGRNPYLQKDDPADIDLDRLKEVFTNAIVACSVAIRQYHDGGQTFVGLSGEARRKKMADLHRDADIRFDELTLLCVVAHRFRPNVVPATPSEIHNLYKEGTVQHSYKAVLKDWQTKKDEAMAEAKAQQPKLGNAQ